ncbi:DgyrCDS344 [Dimorphilus gyrociliatus]|uniref:Probable imidazolonepropionase n=1 Tax=Dimorphilus gyrociliatus TaxID=2664684 RepID=A0A7I8V4E4_9ANNE|nr:DgyrCDS344 [Dimorphilus gyrociliatus]
MAEKLSKRLLIHSATQIVQIIDNQNEFLTGDCMKTAKILNETENSGCCLIVGLDGNIEDIGYNKDILNKYEKSNFEKIIDASGKSIIPGFIDAHTHAVWSGDRVHEFVLKLAGASYMEVHNAGGGINFTVDHVRKATEDELLSSLRDYLRKMMECGTTTVEIKSGYGLDLENEIKMLKVIEKARKLVPIDIVSTYCGAHSIPKGKTADEAVEDIISNQIPQIDKLIRDNILNVKNIDVFCEKGVFNVEQTRRMLNAGKSIGLQINFHGEELSLLESASMGADLGARAISHLEEISEQGIEKMAEKSTAAVLLPTTAYTLRLKRPPARKMIKAGIPLALGSDFNPNAHCFSMPMVMNLACVLFEMSMNEALVASTLNAAYSLGLSKTHGSLQTGKFADLIILDAPRWEHLIYQLGSHSYLIEAVIKKGEVIYNKA